MKLRTLVTLQEMMQAAMRSRALALTLIGLATATLILAVPLTQAQTATTVTVEDAEIDADGEGDVVISLLETTEVVAMHLEIVYDPSLLEWRGIAQGDVLSGALLEANTESPGRAIIGFATLDAVESDGELLTVTFGAIGDEGETPVELENVQAWDSNGFDVLIETSNGTVTIESAFPDWLIYLILALVCLFLLVAALVIFFWFRRRRRRADRPVEVPPGAPMGTVEPRSDQPATTESPKFCSNCGETLKPGAVFCSNCGAKV